ncbi:MAG: hypothetical protein AAFU71_05750 [Cyanobacteria bacterium J06632_22]
MSATVASAAPDTLPDWLCQQLVLGSLPWEQSIPYSEFCDRYTLCDSHWLGTFQQSNGAVACIRWDLLWLPDTLFHQVGQADAVYLFLKFEQLLGMAVTPGHVSARAGALSPSTAPAITNIELEPVDEQHVLLVEDINECSTTVVFAGSLSCLAIAAHNQIIQL